MTDDPTPRPGSRPVQGVLWMLLTGLLIVCMAAVIKHVGNAVPPAQAGFLRFALGLPFVIPMIRPILGAKLTPRQLGLFGLRGMVHAAGLVLWLIAMLSISLAEIAALNYLTPVYVIIGAKLVLGEALGPTRLGGIVVALIGALIILRPDIRIIEAGHVAMLGASMFLAISYLMAKPLSGQVSPPVVVGMLSLSLTVILAPFAYAVWVPPTLPVLGWFFLMACFATMASLTMTLAFAAAPMIVTQPATFLQLLWAVLVGAALFGEKVDASVIVGAFAIIAAITFITWREAQSRRMGAHLG